jgi:hypothetical protein
MMGRGTMLEKAARISSIIQGIAAVVFLYSSFNPASTQQVSDPATVRTMSHLGWFPLASIVFLAASVVAASVLNFAALRQHRAEFKSGGEANPDWRDAFRNPQWRIVNDHVFENASLEVDGKSFHRCKFRNVTLLFHGNAPVEFRETTEVNGTIVFATDNPAILLYESLQRQFGSLPGAKVETGAQDDKGREVLLKIPKVRPIITRVGHLFEEDATAAYSLKMRVFLRNDSPMVVDVRVLNYVHTRVPAQQPLPLATLQLNLQNKWLPDPICEEEIAVLPGHLFRTWLGFDPKIVSKTQLEERLGSLGQLSLLVNDETIELQL